MHLAIWIVTALLLGLWSMLAYGVGALAGLTTGLSSGLPVDWYALLTRIPGAAWLGDWLPGWREAVVAAAQAIGTGLGWLGGALPVIVWVGWGLGAVVLVLCASLLSGLMAWARKAERATREAKTQE